MDLFEAIGNRRAIKKYKDIPVEWDHIGKILEAGRLAPSAGNLQDWKFIVIDNKDTRTRISEICLSQYWMQTAPVHIVVLGDVAKNRRHYGVRGEKFYTIQDCAAATQNMLLAATALGLGSNWVGAFDEEELRYIVGAPPHMRPQAVITLGYADEKPVMPPKYTLENVMYFRAFGGQGNRVSDIDRYIGWHSRKVWNAIDKGKAFADKVIQSGKDEEKKDEP